MTSRIYQRTVLVGHPFTPIGMGEHIRCTYRSLCAAGHSFPIRDIYSLETRNDPGFASEFANNLVQSLGSNTNIFHMNGNEVEQALAHMQNDMEPSAYNIIYPFWELSKYPVAWAKQLEKFDEVWAPSQFIFSSISRAISKPVFHMPMAAEVKIASFLSRKCFSLPESSYLFLFYFDFRSFIERKNPLGLIQAFDELCNIRPGADLRLVIKLNRPADSGLNNIDYQKFCSVVRESKYYDKVIVIDKNLSDNEIKNLVRCCDCFISLHRSEGYGRGMAEAMYFSKPVIATGYSGNMDFMNESNSLLIPFKLIDVKDGEYPFWQGQVWAEPDIECAANHMVKLIDNPGYGYKLGEIASRHIRTHFGYRATGIRYTNRLDEICNKRMHFN